MVIRFTITISILITITLGAVAQSEDSTVVDSTRSKIASVDSVELRYGRDLCDNLQELADSIFSVLHTKKFESVTPYIATADMLKEEFDSMDLERLNRLATIKEQYMVNNLRKDHLKMVKYAKVMHYSLRRMELVTMRVRESEHETGSTVGEVIYLCQSGKHKFYISYTAIRIVGKWFIGDELKITEVNAPGYD